MTLAEATRKNYQLRRDCIYYMLRRLKVVPQIDGCRVFWTEHRKLEAHPFRSVTVTGPLDFGNGITVPMQQTVPMAPGDILKLTLHS